MSSSLLQSRRLSSSLWSEHTLITCNGPGQKVEASMVKPGGSKGAQRAPMLARDPSRTWEGDRAGLSEPQPTSITPVKPQETVYGQKY